MHEDFHHRVLHHPSSRTAAFASCTPLNHDSAPSHCRHQLPPFPTGLPPPSSRIHSIARTLDPRQIAEFIVFVLPNSVATFCHPASLSLPNLFHAPYRFRSPACQPHPSNALLLPSRPADISPPTPCCSNYLRPAEAQPSPSHPPPRIPRNSIDLNKSHPLALRDSSHCAVEVNTPLSVIVQPPTLWKSCASRRIRACDACARPRIRIAPTVDYSEPRLSPPLRPTATRDLKEGQTPEV